MRRRLFVAVVLSTTAIALVPFLTSPIRAQQGPPSTVPKWSLQYFYDEDRTDLHLVDLAFPSAARGIAVGTIAGRDGLPNVAKPRFTAAVTSDGGEHWSLVPLKEQPRSIFFLNDNAGWMVTPQSIWFTEEAGRSWTKISDQIKPNKKLEDAPDTGLILQVWFVTPQHGFAVGLQKIMLETQDGGHTWKPVAEAAKPEANPAFTHYSQIAFADSMRGMVIGGYSPPRRGHEGDLPEWLDPEPAIRRRMVPRLAVELETRDGGSTWSSSTAPLIGSVASLRLAGDFGLGVFAYSDSFGWPSEVFRFDLRSGKSNSVFKQKDRRVTDAIVFPNGRAILAAIEPPGRLANLPVPGKVRMLESSNFSQWTEMKVDYRAVASSIVLAALDADHVWAATDTGMILRLNRQ